MTELEGGKINTFGNKVIGFFLTGLIILMLSDYELFLGSKSDIITLIIGIIFIVITIGICLFLHYEYDDKYFRVKFMFLSKDVDIHFFSELSKIIFGFYLLSGSKRNIVIVAFFGKEKMKKFGAFIKTYYSDFLVNI